MHRRAALWASLGWLAGCTTAGPPAAVSPAIAGWQPLLLPGKRATEYRPMAWDGQQAIRATADRSASMWRRPLTAPAGQPGQVEFAWWVETLGEPATVTDPDREDAPARVLFAFDGDRGRLSARNRMLFDLAQALGGEPPPYATLMYVWDGHAPVDSVVLGARTDRVRKIVLDSGPEHLRRWRTHRRDLRADFLRAFGEEPGPLLAVALMTDGDNTGQRLRTWYSDIRHTPAP